MGEVLPIPAVGDLFTDVRGDDRTMRVSHHADRGVIVVSLWAGAVCRGSFRLAIGDVDRLADLLSSVRPPTPEVPAPAFNEMTVLPDVTGDVSRGVPPTGQVPRVA